MFVFKNIFNRKSNKDNAPLSRIRLSRENIVNFSKIEGLLLEDKIKFDSKGRLRYLHGAPVGDMVLIRVNKDGTPVYKESAEEWFDPGSSKAKDFIWP